MEVTEYLDFFGACYKIPSAQREKTVNDVLELVGLSEKKGALIGALSRGMQKIGRATCRDRVCQYVSIPVVASALIKKSNTICSSHTSRCKTSLHITYNA